jgi:cystathionine beta-lyase
VWTREELTRIGDICVKHQVLILADEIHADLIFSGCTFTPMAALGREMAEKTIVCTAPSKTFNLAGLHTANIIVPDTKARRRFMATLARCGMSKWANPFGLVACETAYREGTSWLTQVLAYVEGNLDFLTMYIHKNIPAIKVIRPEGTYLVWLDCRGLGMDQWQLRDLMLNKARVFLDEGYIFGPEGVGFERINIACPRPILADALERIKTAVEG